MLGACVPLYLTLMSAQLKPSVKAKNPKGFQLEHLFGSKTRARLLGLFLHHPDEQFFVRELTRRIDAQLNSVRREIQNLMDLGVVKEVNTPRKDGKKSAENKKYFQANTASLLFHDLRSLIQKTQVMMKQNLVQSVDESGDVDYLALTGRFVGRGELPVDLLIVGSVSQKDLQSLVRHFEDQLGSELNYTVMPREEFLYRRQITDRFLFSILEGETIVMIDRLDPIPEEMHKEE